MALCLAAASFAQLSMTTVSGSVTLGYSGDGGVAEITAFDEITNQLYVINGVTNRIVVYDFSNPTIHPIPTVTSIFIPSSGSVNSIACYKGLLAAVYENQADRHLNGYVQLITTSGNAFIGAPIEVGAQPDMITFTPQGDKLLVANEGEPRPDYTFDPEGSVTIINVANPFAPTVQHITFTHLNGTIPHLASQPTTMPAIRIYGMKNSVHPTAPGFNTTNVKTPSTVAEDLEPEYITISPDGRTAWVSCQENNAIAVIDIPGATLTTIFGLGYKNHNTAGNGMDIARDPAGAPNVRIQPVPLLGMYQPDGMAILSIGGVPYIFTANEGDSREWSGFTEDLNVNAAFGARMNTSNFTTAQINLITASGVRITNTMGNLDAGLPFMQNSLSGANINIGNNFEQLYTYGTRSFSVWNGLSGQLVWDSGDQLERITYQHFPNNFNADHNGGAAANNARRRSNTKGPEPEAVVLGKIGDSTYAFIALERIGGVMAYNVTDPTKPYFRQYINPRNFAVAPNTGNAGDLGPEGLLFIDADKSPDGIPYLIVSNEVSGTIRAIQLNYSQNIVRTSPKAFVISTNDSESAVQSVSIAGHSFVSPLKVIAPMGFQVSLNSVSGFGGTVDVVFTGTVFGSNVFVKYVGTTPNLITQINFEDVNGKRATPLTVVGVKVVTVTGAPAYTLQVLHASDFEAGLAAMDLAPNFVAIWNKFNNDYPNNTLRVSGGDNFLPSPFFNAASDVVLRNNFRNINNAFLGGTLGGLFREGIGRGDINIMNMLNLHASCVGNHEFDAGTGTLAEMIAVQYDNNATPTEVRWHGVRFPYLSANLDYSGEPNLSGLYTDEIRYTDSYRVTPNLTPDTRAYRKLAPAAIARVGNEDIGLVGATTQIVESISSTGGVKVKGTNANNMPLLASQLQPVIDDLRGRGINKIVLLSHLQQINFEKELATLLSGVDIIVAAGSHTLLADDDDDLEGDTKAGDYPFLAIDKDGNNTLLVCTESEYKYVGRLVVDFDANGNVIPTSYNSILSGAWKTTPAGLIRAGVNTITAFAGTQTSYLTQGLIEGINKSALHPNAITLTGVSATITGIRGLIQQQDGNVFGKTQVYLEGRREGVRQQETNLGNITSDANLWYARSLGFNVQVSLKNGGGIRAAIGVNSAVGSNFINLPPLANPAAGKAAGEISQLDIANSLRFNNGLTVVTVTAAQLLQTVNHAVAASTATNTPGQFAQIGGMRYSFDRTLPAGSRIRTLAVVDSLGNVTDVVAQNGTVVGNAMRTFGMVSLNFLVNGGDNYPFPSFNTANPSLFNRMNVYTISGDAPTLTFNDRGSEQIAFAEYLKAAYPRTSAGFNVADTPVEQDLRIQNLLARTELILPDFTFATGTFTGVVNTVASFNNVPVTTTRLAAPITIMAPSNISINGANMATISGMGGDVNVSLQLPATPGVYTPIITLTAANLIKTFTQTLVVVAAPTPSISVTGGPFTYTRVFGSGPIVEAEQKLTIAGENLSGDVVVYSDLAQVTFYKNSPVESVNPLVITITSGTLAATEVGVRFLSTVAGTYTGVVMVSTAGANTFSTDVSATVTYINALTQANNIGALVAYPNPVTEGTIYFNELISGELVNSLGVTVKSFNKLKHVSVADLPKGLYILKSGSNSVKFEIQ